MQMMDLEALFRAALQGLPGADERLYKAVQARLSIYFSIRFMSDDVKDLVQDATMVVLTKLHEVTPGRPFERWLTGVARNVTLREYEARRQRARLRDAIEHEPVKPPTSLHSALMRAESCERMLEQIQQLPEGMRAVIEHDLLGGDPAELAEAQQVRRGTLRSRRHRAKRQTKGRTPARRARRVVRKLTDSSSQQER